MDKHVSPQPVKVNWRKVIATAGFALAYYFLRAWLYELFSDPDLPESARVVSTAILALLIVALAMLLGNVWIRWITDRL